MQHTYMKKLVELVVSLLVYFVSDELLLFYSCFPLRIFTEVIRITQCNSESKDKLTGCWRSLLLSIVLHFKEKVTLTLLWMVHCYIVNVT